MTIISLNKYLDQHNDKYTVLTKKEKKIITGSLNPKIQLHLM